MDPALVIVVIMLRRSPEGTVQYVWRDLFEHHMMVNRPEGLVTHTMIAGHMAWANGAFTDPYGQIPMGRCLRHRDHATEAEWSVEPAPALASAA